MKYSLIGKLVMRCYGILWCRILVQTLGLNQNLLYRFWSFNLNIVTKVVSSDSTLWNQTQVWSEISFAMATGSNLEICLNSEGPDFKTLEIDQYIESESLKYSYDLGKVTVRTSNMIEGYNKVKVKKTFPRHLMINSLEYDCKIIKSNDLKNFGLFVGRSNAPRLFLGAYLYNHYQNKMVHTNHFNRQNDFYCANVGIEELFVKYGINDIDMIAHYLTKCPINSYGLPYQTNDNKNHAMHLISHDKNNFIKHYEKFFVEIVCETYFTGDTFFPTEKTWRPILLKTPFILQGPKGYLKHLKRLGFKTFSNWWSEGYDEDDPGTSWHTITYIIDELSLKTPHQLSEMLIEMKDVLDHNRQRFFELNYSLSSYDDRE